MLRSVGPKTVRDAARGLVWWSAGIVALVLLTNAFYPSIRGNEDYERLLDDYPDVVKAFIGEDLTSPAGYLESQLFSFMVPLLLLIYAVGAGARAIAGEEEAGTLDLLLAQPVSRTRVVLEKAGALAALLAVLAVVLFAAIWAPASAFELDIGAGNVVAAVAGSYLIALLHGYVALLVGAATGSRAAALGVSAVLAVGAYFLNALGEVVDALEPWRPVSPFSHVGDPLRNGFGAGMLVLLGLAAIAAAAAPALFARRDVAT